MAKSNPNPTPWILGGLGLVAALLYYLKEGAGSENDAALIPNSIEAKLDRIVDALNQRFGRQWVNQGLARLEQGLTGFLPAPLVAMVEVVHKTEQWAKQQQAYGVAINSYGKRRYAATQFQA